MHTYRRVDIYWRKCGDEHNFISSEGESVRSTKYEMVIQYESPARRKREGRLYNEQRERRSRWICQVEKKGGHKVDSFRGERDERLTRKRLVSLSNTILFHSLIDLSEILTYNFSRY